MMENYSWRRKEAPGLVKKEVASLVDGGGVRGRVKLRGTHAGLERSQEKTKNRERGRKE